MSATMAENWAIIETGALADETALLAQLVAQAGLDSPGRARISAAGADLVRRIRANAKPGLMEVFLAEYGLSTHEGIALMCLAEALLRVPDAPTMDALIEDKIVPSDWGRHLGKSASSLVNASTWALMLTGKVLNEKEAGMARHLRGAIKRLGEPVIRRAATRAMKEMGKQFVLGETIKDATQNARTLEAEGYSYSYDMLGEAARTEADARRYHLSYTAAITALAQGVKGTDIRQNPGISVKLSALHPRYEWAKQEDVITQLVPRLRALAGLAKAAGIGLNIDAEEADRLALSLRVIEKTLEDESLAGWDGFGVVVQAYGRRAGAVIDWLYGLAERLDRKIMVRLVKGAYWDSEIKRAQTLGLAGFPVFTRKQTTDISYIAQARKLLAMTDRIYPQFATHNAHTIAAILDMAGDLRAFEFQRLHGMGEQLHDLVLKDRQTRCRIYAPVGAHRDLLAYLVRRLLENGANSSFVHQIVNEDITPEQVAACPFDFMQQAASVVNPALPNGTAIFAPRRNSRGFDLADKGDLDRIFAARAPFETTEFAGHSLLAGQEPVNEQAVAITNPATGEPVGTAWHVSADQVPMAAQQAQPWDMAPAQRAAILRRAADLYEENFGPIFALLAREAGKTLSDAVAELREAVDFLRYYADQGETITGDARGVFVCISPWNFPLAIFTGQIAAALMAGNGVLAKPAEQTPLIAAFATHLLHQAGVPRVCLQLLLGDGPTIGAALVRQPQVAGVVFTGSTKTAQAIRRDMAQYLEPSACLIAETGGINAMLVDSTALAEQAVRDIVAGAFQSAGQRCSALRCLYVQDDIADDLLHMLFGAMDLLSLGNPLTLSTDIGPLIDGKARRTIEAHIAKAQAEGRVLKAMAAPPGGHFLAPHVIAVNGIEDIAQEIFGPVLHVAMFKAGEIDDVLKAINHSGYGLTFALHSRIDDRVQNIIQKLQMGNIYVNRNQIGAVVGSQPFGGEGLSGTGPKAGGPHYMRRFLRPETAGSVPLVPVNGFAIDEVDLQNRIDVRAISRDAVDTADLPGPTGESNRLSLYQRTPILCLGPHESAALAQVKLIEQKGGLAVFAAGIAPEMLARLTGFSGVIYWGADGRAHHQALAARSGAILPFITGHPDAGHLFVERHVSIDTTASGGNARLLATGALGE